MPIVFSICTAARLLDIRSAARMRHRVGGRVLVFRHPVALLREDRIVEVIDQRRRRVSVLDRRGVDERLERGAATGASPASRG